MALEYKSIIKKIDESKSMTKNEKIIVKEAVDQMFSKYAIGVNGIVSMFKVTADKKTFNTFRQIISRAKARKKKGGKALDEKDRKLLKKVLSYLRKESVNRICSAIQNGDYLFLEMLNKKMKEVDLEEMDKLQRIIEKL